MFTLEDQGRDQQKIIITGPKFMLTDIGDLVILRTRTCRLILRTYGQRSNLSCTVSKPQSFFLFWQFFFHRYLKDSFKLRDELKTNANPRSSFIITNRPQSSNFIFLINWDIWIDTGVSHGENQINGHIFRVSGFHHTFSRILPFHPF